MLCTNWGCSNEYSEDRNGKYDCQHHPGKFQFGSMQVIGYCNVYRDYGLRVGLVAGKTGKQWDALKDYILVNQRLM
jgi:hypothetical protein